ncbi:DNA-directed RNA polymerase subunit D [Candidatus Woesearchaeota archaeon]|nr:DNA-directed RNA polymerase subunit D [Candidatus Woesearchaeota archaeon]
MEDTMEVHLLDNNKKEGKVSFLIEGSNPAFASLIRKTILDEVPTMAIEDVEFRKNSSILYDEILAHRLGLIPLKTDLKSYDLPENCKCEGAGCAKCTLKLTLKAKGPGIVYASEIESQDPKVVPVFPKLPIVKLMKGQSLEFEATAVLGKGKTHAKWSPGHCFFKYKPKIEVGKKVENPEDVAKVCPINVFDVKNNSISINKDNLLKCHLCGACTEVSSDIKLNESEDDFVFFIESWGQLSPKDMVCTALDIIKIKIDNLSKELK